MVLLRTPFRVNNSGDDFLNKKIIVSSQRPSQAIESLELKDQHSDPPSTYPPSRSSILPILSSFYSTDHLFFFFPLPFRSVHLLRRLILFSSFSLHSNLLFFLFVLIFFSLIIFILVVFILITFILNLFILILFILILSIILILVSSSSLPHSFSYH